VTVTLAEEGKKTKVTVRMVFPSAAAREPHREEVWSGRGADPDAGSAGVHLGRMETSVG
jgi:hypothetical protein